jgi:xylulokinase
MRIGLDGFTALGFKPKEIRLTGGGSKSHLWQSIAANVTNLPVRTLTGAEAAAMGGAIQALWCLKISEGKKISIEVLADEHVELGDTIKPDKKSAALYKNAYADYSKYLKALSPLYK